MKGAAVINKKLTSLMGLADFTCLHFPLDDFNNSFVGYLL